MKKLVIATQNRNKFTEMKNALMDVGWQIVPAYEFPGIPSVEEDGKTLEDNSLKKAKLISQFTKLPALADDTGLFVEELCGQPGIYAARFAGENCSYEDNVKKLLNMMKNAPKTRRKAVFRTVITLYYPDRDFQQTSGEVEGVITEEVQGKGGFGYDPIFQPVGYSKVFAEMSLSEKNQISHRGKAVQKIIRLLEND